MKQSAPSLIALAALLNVSSGFAQSRQRFSSAAVDAAFSSFWAADSADEASRRADLILKAGVTFDDALRRLRLGRTYRAEKTGVIQMTNRTEDGVPHTFAVNIPSSYDPSRRYQMRVQLHGGVNLRTDNKPRNSGEIGALAGAEQIYVLPYAWESAPWWSDDQILNLRAILNDLKRNYNVDENRVVLTGVSDGATGAYFMAMTDTTPFAGFLPLNGFILVLSLFPAEEGRIFPNNLRNKPLFVVNGGKDPLYPTSTVEPFTRRLMSAGVEIDYHPQPEGRHDTHWWPEVRDLYEQFVTAHPRDPHPARLTWEAADPARSRAHWLVIESLGESPGDMPAPLDGPREGSGWSDANRMWGLNSEGVMFLHPIPSGRVDLERSGNTVKATTRGVSAFTILLSPDRFDLNQPVRVVANGREYFNGRVTPNVRTLLKWAARDNDRTMLYAAELRVNPGCHGKSGDHSPCAVVSE
jgi:dienelactone hydrolase